MEERQTQWQHELQRTTVTDSFLFLFFLKFNTYQFSCSLDFSGHPEGDSNGEHVNVMAMWPAKA